MSSIQAYNKKKNKYDKSLNQYNKIVVPSNTSQQN